MQNRANGTDRIQTETEAPLDRSAGRDERGSDRRAGAVTPPSISLPRGGGAIRGIGEKFDTNPATGTGRLQVPLAVTPSPSGFGPSLSLAYDSGAGNGPFGFGWSLSTPSVSRKTDKGLPRYLDGEDEDVFLISEAEDLVPVLLQQPDGTWEEDSVDRTIGAATYQVRRYRPRVEGLFARIERWRDRESGETHWRSISRDNVTTLYGMTADSRIADPADATRVFQWLICASYDDKGNVILYDYQAESADGVALSQAHERNRTDASRAVNRYLKHVRYGNAVPRADGPAPADLAQRFNDLSGLDYRFEVVFDYDEGHLVPVSAAGEDPQRFQASPLAARRWSVRSDPFSRYRAGFEVRTYRLCRRILMFHHFRAELGAQDTLVKSTELEFEQTPTGSFVVSVLQSGYSRLPDGSYRRKSLPPLELEYSRAEIQDEVREIDPRTLENLPEGVDGTRYLWVDLDGEGSSGILTEQAGGMWYYKRNLSPAFSRSEDGRDVPDVRFAAIETVASLPVSRGTAGARFFDLAGDGRLDRVELGGPTSGFYEREPEEGWSRFRSFTSLPNANWDDPNLRFVDLTGDGHADVLIADDQVFTWHASLAEEGFGEALEAAQPTDEEQGPRLVFADGTQSIYLADLSGDGLTDLARIRNGDVCYWPNLGYGRFGAKVTMDGSPWFDAPDLFDQGRIRLADVDGNGVVDILYLGAEGVDYYRNESGNAFAAAHRLAAFPGVDDLSAVSATDLFGNGTSCLVWSSPLPGDAGRAMRYVDLMGGVKPHLLLRTANNLGAETHVRYAPSTRFYVEDKLAGRPWATRLPFPVQVVERVERLDRVSRNRFVTRYSYHHGYFDAVEREFRGFGRVEQVDTEELGVLTATGELSAGDNLDESSHVPPVETRTWFHTGAYLEDRDLSRRFAAEYFREPELSDEDAEAMLLPDTDPSESVLRDGTAGDELREAHRALKGAVLRQEVYARDGSAEELRPYTVSERSYGLRRLQPRGGNRHAVFFTHPRESVELEYERKVFRVGGVERADPRVTHTMTLDVNEFGNVLESVSIAYGRRHASHDDADPILTASDRAEQERTPTTYTVNDYTNPVAVSDPVAAEDAYRTPRLCESRTYELLEVTPAAARPNVTNLFGFEEMRGRVAEAGDGLHEIAYEDVAAAAVTESHPYRRLVEHVRTRFRRNDLTGLLPLGGLESRALPGETCQLALTPGLVADVFGGRITDPELAGEGGYVHSEGDASWWIPSSRVFFSPDDTHTPAQELVFAQQHFFLPHRFEDPFGGSTTVEYENELLPRTIVDAVGNTIVAENDFRVLEPRRVTDPNGNRSEAAFDALGLVAGTAVRGKAGEDLGDSLAGFVADPSTADVQAHLLDPLADPHGLLQDASTRLVYDLDAYRRTRDEAQPQPAVVCSLFRETHAAPAPAEPTRIQQRFSYSDGFGREIQVKARAESGPLVAGGPDVDPRWVGTGWTVFNNKGQPVRRYEPFFSDTHSFEYARTVGVSPILFYDPVGRIAATLRPDHAWEKIVFDPWRQETWDVNDTVLIADPRTDPDVGDFFNRLPAADFLPGWREQRIGGALGPAEQDAALKASEHAGTPAVAHRDSLGRTIVSILHNDTPVEQRLATRTELDIEGKPLTITDALGRTVMEYRARLPLPGGGERLAAGYDAAGNLLFQNSMDAGERRTLANVGGSPMRVWDALGHRVRTTYDGARRPLETAVRLGAGPERTAERTVYGEAQGTAGNHRGRVFRQFDSAGQLTFDAYDFKGNPARVSRRFLTDWELEPDWAAAPALAPAFVSETTFDALGRPVTLTAPDSSVVRPRFNEANLLESVEADLPGAAAATVFVEDVDYDAKGQRRRIVRATDDGFGVTTEYEYDPLTFRLRRLRTTRGGDSALLQDLRYTYDPVGNVMGVEDRAQQTIYFRNHRVDPAASYVYDALYRLIEATGREHLGLAASGDALPPSPTSPTDAPRVGLLHRGDGRAVGGYRESYSYDAVGNLLEVRHLGTDPLSPGWTRTYTYPSGLAASNRLTSVTVGATTSSYSYDGQGHVTAMPHLQLLEWSFEDRLRRIDLGGGGTAFYAYGGSGQRARKVIERQNGTRRAERLYLGGWEVYREYDASGNGVTLQRESLHINDENRLVALVETQTVSGGAPVADPTPLVRHQLGNHLGSASLELDHGARIITYEEYYPFGSTSYQAGRTQVEVRQKRYRYVGRERDEESGLCYHGARYYAPWLGRWTSADPAGLVDGLNLYRYSRNNPIRLIDPRGTQSDDPQGLELPLPDLELSRRTRPGTPPLSPPTEENQQRITATRNRLILSPSRLELRSQVVVDSSYPPHLIDPTVLHTSIRLTGFGRARARAELRAFGFPLLTAEADARLRYSTGRLARAAFSDIERSIENERLSLDSLQNFVRTPGFSLSGRIRLFGAIPITRFQAESPTIERFERPLPGSPPFALTYQAYGAIIAPAGTLFDIDAPAVGFVRSSFSAERGYSFTSALLPTISTESLSAGEGFLRSFPVYGYAEATFVWRAGESLDLGVSVVGSLSSVDVQRILRGPDPPPSDPTEAFNQQLTQYREATRTGVPEPPKANLGITLSARF